MTTETRLMTAEDLWQLPDDGQRHELVDGVLITMPPNSAAHGQVAATFGTALWKYVETHKLGVPLATCGYILRRNPDTVRAADISFIRQARKARLEEGYPTRAPDLAVDIIDPWERYLDVMQKTYEWLDAGTRMVMLIDPRRHSVTIHRPTSTSNTLTEDDQIDGADVVPGWTMPIRALFE